MFPEISIAQLMEYEATPDNPDPWPPALKFAETFAPDTDAANAQRFCEAFGRDLLLIRGLGWHRWDGKRWVEDPDYPDRCAQDLGRLIGEEAIARQTEALDVGGKRTKEQKDALRKEGEALLRWARLSESSPRMEAAKKHAKAHLTVLAEDVDSDRDKLNTRNGVLDLRSWELKPPTHSDLMTQMAGCSWEPEVDCPLWLETLADIFPNQQVIDYLQRYFGYCLTGSVSEQQMTIFWGVGRNGKSTIVNTLRSLLGTYARQAPPDLLMLSSSGRHNELADLYRARLITTAESREKGRLDENLVKSITGGDPIKGRKLYKDYFEFWPTHKLLLQTNHKPQIVGTDLGIWRRVHLVPFTTVIPPEKCDPDRDRLLLAELPGILHWTVEGCKSWREQGLNPPSVVREATEEYRRDQDMLRDFLEECCEIKPLQQVTARAIYSRYQDWCRQNGERDESHKWLWTRLAERGITKKKSGGQIVYFGIGVVQNEDARYAR